MKTQQLLAAGAFVASCAALAGCDRPEPPKYDVGNAQLQAHYDKTTGRLASITYDSNKNGKIDTWSYMNAALVVRIEIDKDEDGKIDRWEYYTEDQKLEKVGYSRANNGRADAWAYQGADGKLAKLELAAEQSAIPAGAPPAKAAAKTEPAPRIVRTEYYANGVLSRVEEDTNGDGRIDKWESYEAGALATVAFDTTGRGKPDRRIVYAKGAVRVEVDPDGTGQFKPAK